MLKYFGVFFGNDAMIKKTNWNDIIVKLENGSGSSTQRQNPCPEQPRGLDAVAPPYLFGGLLAQIQTRVLYFFWDGQHWVPQGVLFLPREEGGQGLIHLASRVGIYRVQCLQCGLAWTDGSNMPNPDPSPETPAGTTLSDSQAVVSLLGIRSTRVARKVLQLWRERFRGMEMSLLVDYNRGAEPDGSDPFLRSSGVPSSKVWTVLYSMAQKPFNLHKPCTGAVWRC